MSRSGVFYVVKAMERTAAGTAAAGAARVPAQRAVDREAAAAADRRDGSTASLMRRVLAAVRHSVGGTPAATDRGRRRLGSAARAD
jgi:hypothetical protein